MHYNLLVQIKFLNQKYELAEFLRLIRTKGKNFTISSEISQKISCVMEQFMENKNKHFI